jgi:NTP pyrophosphatase (non-canonical NTP hydrolase)
MAKNFIDYELLEFLSASDAGVALHNKVIKLSEETGEVSQAYLGVSGSKNVSKSSSATYEGILEECCDVVNVAVDIINSLGFPDEVVKAMFDKKLNKWKSKVEKY